MKIMLTVGRYFKQRFGEKVRKIPISLSGFTCPNIDGKVAKGGCIYCKNETFSPSLVMKKKQNSNIDSNNTESTQEQNIKDITKLKMNFSLTENPLLPTQLRELETQFHYHANFHKNKYGIKKYMVYFQSFTNTYAPFDTLKALYTKALKLPDVVGMSIGTRVDCVDSKLLDFLGEFVKGGKEIWLEYGIQSIYEETLKLTNRGHTMEGVESLFKETRKRGIKVCAHLIYGLPNESVDMMIHSLQTILSYGVDSLKIHPLYVVEGTALARMYKKGEYTPISLEDYGEAIAKSLKLIPPNIVIQRVSAGAHDESLIAPKWCFDKNIQMRYLRDRLKKEGIDY
ncbi:TIGR01212 family radical SAM protein [Helicobacter bilis ATCC 43879]|uniref:TIGR01212 family radical SAM protein n=2 Tax=Helicobacteraceae TaxID=72293 RepID=C3XG24_9HELI|nr:MULTISPECIES: TIGR01212 family radical SAM protein [Helicobacter]EEO23963.2 TIGR01212 family radical SAM protein [Helicobacter bilis ATCC 43879]